MLRLLVNDLKISPENKTQEGRTALHEAAAKGHDLMIYMLAEMGAQVNMLDNRGFTPLHYAVENQHVTSVKFLISLGASVNATNNEGNTSLHLAVIA